MSFDSLVLDSSAASPLAARHAETAAMLTTLCDGEFRFEHQPLSSLDIAPDVTGNLLAGYVDESAADFALFLDGRLDRLEMLRSLRGQLDAMAAKFQRLACGVSTELERIAPRQLEQKNEAN